MTDDVKRPKIELVQPDSEDKGEPGIPKPGAFSLEAFRSKTDPTIAGVETLQTALPHYRIGDARDFVRLHSNEKEYWSPELCFVNVPIKGMKRDTLHLILEEVALRNLSSKKIQRFRLVLGAKPHDVFFLCQVPSQNLDNDWNKTNWDACQLAKTSWVEVTSRKAEGVDGYKIDFARNPGAFPEPNWPKQSLERLIEVTFTGRMICTEDHPALFRLVGDKPELA